MCRPTILGWCMARQSSPTRAGIRCPGFFGAASDSRSVSDLESDTSEGLGGDGATGDTTGMAVELSSTITPTSRTAETSATTDSIIMISITAALAVAVSAIATLTAQTPATETRSTVGRAFTRHRERTRARWVDLITAEMSEGFPRAGGRALEVAAASMEVVPMAVAGGTR